MSDITRIKVTKNGPYLVSGDVELVDSDGNIIERLTKAALCRCGHSESKPFCDGSHRTFGFEADTIRPKQ